MAFSIFFILKPSIFSGLSASLNSLFEASAVTLSFVLKLRRQEIRTRKGLFVMETIVTIGTIYFLFSRLRMVTISSILSNVSLTGVAHVKHNTN